MMELLYTFCLSAKRSPRINVAFKHLSVISHLSVILTFPDFLAKALKAAGLRFFKSRRLCYINIYHSYEVEDLT